MANIEVYSAVLILRRLTVRKNSVEGSQLVKRQQIKYGQCCICVNRKVLLSKMLLHWWQNSSKKPQ